MPLKPSGPLSLSPLALGVLLCAAAYLPWLGSPLVWDDLSVIVNNEALDRPVSWRQYASPDYFRFSTESTWRPAATAATRAAARAAGRSPLGHRLPLFALHLALGLLLFRLAVSLGLTAEASGWAAALFLLHPAHVETLLCASFNEDVLAALGVVGLLLLHRGGRPAAAAAAFAAGLLGKENAAVGLPLAWLMDRLAPPARGGPGARAYAAYAAVLAGYAALRFGPLAGPAASGALAAAAPLGERLHFGAWAFAESVRILLLPLRLRLEYFAVPPELAGAGLLRGLAAAGLLAAILAGALRLRRRAPAAALGLLWPVVALAAVSPLLPVNVLNLRLTAERFLYLPAAGAALTAGRLLAGRRAAPWILAGALTCLTALRASDWAYEPRLWSGLAAIYPWSSKAHEGLGEAWLRQSRPELAAIAFERALAVRRSKSDRVLAHYQPRTGELAWESPSLERKLGLALLQLGDETAAEAQFRRAIALAPAAEGFSYRAAAYLAARRGDWAGAAGLAEEGLAHNPADEFLRRLAAEARAGRLTLRARFF